MGGTQMHTVNDKNASVVYAKSLSSALNWKNKGFIKVFFCSDAIEETFVFPKESFNEQFLKEHL